MASSDMQDVKRRIKSVTSMEHITNAMKLVSAAKLRRAKATFEKTHENFNYITYTIAEIFHNTDQVPQKYLAGNREVVKTCYILISSCRGLCGSFNTNIIREAEAQIKADPEKPVIVAIGSKVMDYFMKRGYEIQTAYCLPPENISFLETREISRPIIEMYDRGEIDEIVLIYTTFVNTMEQRVKSITLLPFEVETGPDIIRHVREVEYEPSLEEVFNYLIPKYVEIMVHGAVVESATCEHAARRMAMENATENARDMLGDLTLFYNRARQAAITKEIVEIIAGSEAQK